MKTTIEFLDKVKSDHGLTSDYQLSKFLGCTRASISSYRMKKSFLDEEMAMKVAFELNLDDGYVLACIASERARKPEVKAAWKHTAEMLYGLAAVLAVLAVLPFVPGIEPDSLSGAALLGFTTTEGGALNIMSNAITTYWPLLFILATLALLAFPRYSRHNPPP